MVRLSCDCPVESLKLKFVPLRPTRSTFPSSSRLSGSPQSYSANRMLDEPPFIVRREHDSRLASKILAVRPTPLGLLDLQLIDGHQFRRRIAMTAIPRATGALCTFRLQPGIDRYNFFFLRRDYVLRQFLDRRIFAVGENNFGHVDGALMVGPHLADKSRSASPVNFIIGIPSIIFIIAAL